MLCVVPLRPWFRGTNGRGDGQVGDHFQGVEREGLVEGELVLEVHSDPHPPAIGVRLVQLLHDPGVTQRPIYANGPANVAPLALSGFVVVDQ